jgi:hypothetical protein
MLIHYENNGHAYNNHYYLVSSIYPDWSTLVKTIQFPANETEVRFTKEEEAWRKDVEGVFGVMQSC